MKPLPQRDYDFSNVLEKHALPEDIPTLFRKTAEEICGAFYEDNHRTKEFRAHWGKIGVYKYVKLNWASFLPAAKEILAGMLQDAQAHENDPVHQFLKDEIYEAFCEQGASSRLIIQ
jgi:hypothetical protein